MTINHKNIKKEYEEKGREFFFKEFFYDLKERGLLICRICRNIERGKIG
jgi:hypothetical protein